MYLYQLEDKEKRRVAKMNSIKSIIYLIGLLFCLYCEKEPDSTEGIIELRYDFSESEFKNAIIGKWESVYEIEGKENIKNIDFSKKGKAKLKLEKNTTRKEFEGNYKVDFLRPPSKGSITWAEITIKTSKDKIILSGVHFDLHIAFPVDSGLFLRIDEPPYGVLKRIK